MNQTTEKPEARDTASDADKSRVSDGNKTGINQIDFDKGVDVGFAKGATKAKKELFAELGTEDVDVIKSALAFVREHEENQKSAAERLEGLKSENEQLKTSLKEYQERENTEAQALFEKLTEEQQASIKAAGLPLGRLTGVMKTMMEGTKTPSKSVGTPFQPSASDNQDSGTLKFTKHFGLDPEYRKNPQAYIQKRIAEFEAKNESLRR